MFYHAKNCVKNKDVLLWLFRFKDTKSWFVIVFIILMWWLQTWSDSNQCGGNLRGLQSVNGEPIYPSGHVHFGSWFNTLQIAVGAHGLSSAQGLIHLVFWHAVYRGQSSFWRHPTDRTGAVGNPTIIENMLLVLMQNDIE